MAATDRRPVPRVVNQVWSYLIRRGMAPHSMSLITVSGRKTGKPYTVVVGLVTQNGEQYLVSPYGEVNWVQNARAAEKLSVRHGKEEWTARIEEQSPQQSAPVLKKYLSEHPVTRPYFEIGSAAPVEAFEGEAPRHPVFLLHRI
ncbi:MAG TPA: nitroreductase family deazaflavin-dependent oxidoreductase [Aggregatilineales bacterium]|nr:nitroreductase family deazaflavin-dependent oxidoreductase [Aggregatilineales bacterium]